MRFGYSRVSTAHQNEEAQIKALRDAGIDELYSEKVSGKSLDRKQFKLLLSKAKKGDTIVVTGMDRIARNVREGIVLIDELNEQGITLHVLNIGVFDNSPTSKLVRNILLSVAEFEREIMLERQREGIAAARERGAYKGKPIRFGKKHKGLQHAIELYKNRDENKLTVKDICEITKVGRTTFYNKLKEYGVL